MSSYPINIADFEYKEILNSAEISVPYVLNALDCSVLVRVKNSNGEIRREEYVYITPAEYALWTTDDNYLIDLALQKMGLTRIP